MREAFHEQLGEIGRDLSTMADLAAASLRGASVALLNADMTRPPEVERGAETMDRLQRDLESRVLDLFARRRPAAEDLRLLAAALHMSTDLERMAELAVHLADIARRRHPRHAIPARLSALVAQMAADSAELADGASHIIKGQDLETARVLEMREDTVDELHRQLLAALLVPEAGYAARDTVDVTLAGRYYERFADHAVTIARGLESVPVPELRA